MAVRYTVSGFQGPEEELKRLADQASAALVEELDTLHRLGFPRAGMVLDVGCGSGDYGKNLQKRWGCLNVIGVDTDKAALKAAQEKCWGVIEHDMARAPFYTSAVGAVTRLMLRHNPEPVRVLANIRQSVKSGSCVVAIDVSDSTLVLDPAPDRFYALSQGRAAWFAERNCDGDVGGKMARMMQLAGFTNIRTEVVVISTETLGASFAPLVLQPWIYAAKEHWGRDPELLAYDPDLIKYLDEVMNWTGFGSINLYMTCGIA